MRDLGYREVALGNWWKNGERNADGTIALDPSNGRTACARNGRAARAGASPSARTPTSALRVHQPKRQQFGHYQQDADTIAAWGLDAMTVDWCGAY